MGSTERRERERLAMREQILNAARELFAERGYQAVTMREIGKRIQYSATALYHHFADKEALMLELCRLDFADFAQRFLTGVMGAKNPLEAMCRAGLIYLGFAEQFPQHYRLMFMTPLPEAPPEAGEREDPRMNAYVFLRQLIETLLSGDYLRPELKDVDLISQTTWAALHGAAALELTVHKQDKWLDFKPRRDRFADVLRLLCRGMLRDPLAAEKQLDAVLADSPGFGVPAGKSKPAKAKAPPKKG
ncbi:MAG TPA: TetR/AcrR family transcriptional regulator [Polyangiaceae bacterium]|nr:TetR/AcrR family transcriptional regulator [Polyangiaceae bacterium]